MNIVQVLATEGAAGIPSAAYKSRFSLLCNQVDFSAVFDLYTLRGNSGKQRSLACKDISCTLKPDLSLSREIQMDFLAVSMGRS